MSILTDAAAEAPGPVPSPSRAADAPRPLYWSLRRELWENRALWIAPLAAAGVVLFGFLLGAIHPPHVHLRQGSLTAAQVDWRMVPYGVAAVAVMVVGAIVGFFYCLGALIGERRDRSILFWKSLPVSDVVTVASKALVPFVVIPVILFAVIVSTWIVMLAVDTVRLTVGGDGVGALWAEVPLVRMTLVLAYGLVVLALWYAPIWAWLLLVSGWARGMTFLWAVGPWLALCVIEKIGFDSNWLASMLKYRLSGAFGEAFDFGASHGSAMDLSQLEPMRFLAAPALWSGWAVAAAFLALTVRQRRYRGPI